MSTLTAKEGPAKEGRSIAEYVNPAVVITALVFGVGALAIVSAGLTIPVPGSDVVSDPRELCATIGAALTGPVGGIIIGLMAGIREPVVVLPSTLAHVAGGLWMGFAYRKLVYERSRMPFTIVGWAALVLTYYYVILVPGFVIGQALTVAIEQGLAPLSLDFLPQTYATLATGALPEALLTTAVTALVLAALPRKYHRPLWGNLVVATQRLRAESAAPAEPARTAAHAHSGGAPGRLRMLRSSFAWRLAILLLIMSFIPIAVMAVFVRHTVADSFVTLTSQETRVQARQLAAEVSLLSDESAVQTVLTASSDDQHLALVIGGDGESVIHPRDYRADPSGLAVLPASAVNQLLTARDGVLTETTSGHVIGYAPVPGKNQVAVVIMEGSVISNAIQQMETASFIQLGASLLIIVILAGVAIWVVMSPIQRLTKAAEEVGAGRLDVEINLGDMEGELATLAVAFNQMTKRLQESYDTLERRVDLRTQELATVNAISDLVSQSLDLEEILKTALDQMIEIGHFDVGASYRLADDGRGFELAANEGVADEIVHYVKNLPLGRIQNGSENGVAQPSVKTLAEYPEDDLKRILERERLHTVVTVPLVAKGKTVGAMGLATRSARELTAQDLSLLAAIGQQVGMAVENARLYEHAEQIAVAAERNRLARDLHDAVTQTLFSASLIAEVLPRIFERNQDEGRRRLEELRQLTRGALAEMRTLLLELRPAALVEAPLANLMRHLAEATIGRARIPVRLTAEEGIVVPADVQVALYRIAQEALNNVAKHSGAREAAIALCQRNGQVELVIGDNGRGFDPSKVSSDHLGVGIIRERAQAIGATLRIESEQDQGTRIIVTWSKADA